MKHLEIKKKNWPCFFLQASISTSPESKLEVMRSGSSAGELKMTHRTGWWPILGIQTGVTVVSACKVEYLLLSLVLAFVCLIILLHVDPCSNSVRSHSLLSGLENTLYVSRDLNLSARFSTSWRAVPINFISWFEGGSCPFCLCVFPTWGPTRCLWTTVPIVCDETDLPQGLWLWIWLFLRL